MLSSEHESPIALANLEPGLIAWLLVNVFKIEVDDYDHARPHPTEAQVLVSRSFNCDGVLVFCDADDEPLFAVVLEVQRQWDVEKLRTWKLYLANIEVDLRVQAELLVYCEDPATARRYRRRLAAQRRGLSLQANIFTPEDVPLVLDVDIAHRNPALVVLSALCHGDQPEVDDLFPVLAEALEATEHARAVLFYDVVLAGLPVPARERWEKFMTTTENYQFHSEAFRANYAAGRAEGRAEGEALGEARGEARSVLIALEGRGIEVPGEVRDRVLACTDSDQLQAWLRLAVTATTIDDVITD